MSPSQCCACAAVRGTYMCWGRRFSILDMSVLHDDGLERVEDVARLDDEQIQRADGMRIDCRCGRRSSYRRRTCAAADSGQTKLCHHGVDAALGWCGRCGCRRGGCGRHQLRRAEPTGVALIQQIDRRRERPYLVRANGDHLGDSMRAIRAGEPSAALHSYRPRAVPLDRATYAARHG